ncbi:MAG TPA: hypothetical protein VLA13_05510 [Massilibacterium sp.]|nr:hypothetical protein [Massilibacterium sp.]
MIDLDRIIESNPRKYCTCTECQKWIMKEAIRQALELASEEAQVTTRILGEDGIVCGQEITVDKASIMNVLEKVK